LFKNLTYYVSKSYDYVGNKTREQLKPFHFEGLFDDEIGRAKTKKLFCFGAMETFIKKIT
jgi:hypothetical protein